MKNMQEEWRRRKVEGENARSGCPDSNRGPSGPKPDALTRLRYIPKLLLRYSVYPPTEPFVKAVESFSVPAILIFRYFLPR